MRRLIVSTGIRAGSLLLCLGTFGVAQTSQLRGLPLSCVQQGKTTAPTTSLASLPVVAQAKISAALGRDSRAYQVRQTTLVIPAPAGIQSSASRSGAVLVAENMRN